jgi:hypothetical protein
MATTIGIGALMASQRAHYAECSNIVEGVQIVDNERGDCFHALQLLLPEIESTRTTEFMHHTGHNSLRVHIRQEDQRGIDARGE